MASNVYTRGGDGGQTSLVGGERVAKNSARLEAYGTIDEFSSFLGALEADPSVPEELKGQLRIVQNKLFNVGGYLATLPAHDDKPKPYGLNQEDIDRLEGWIDAMDEQIPKIRAFVLPGGTPAAAKAHIARSVCRRAERRILTLSEESYVDSLVIRYTNRLSDYLFIAARYLNFILGTEEIVWDQTL